jgi:hypothetical protein
MIRLSMRCTAAMILAALLPSVAASATPAPASSPVRRATFTGHLDFGMDVTGEFGAPMTDLTGMNWTAVFIFNPQRGNRTTMPGNTDAVAGGPVTPPTFENPILRASFTLQGVTRDFSPRIASNVGITQTAFAPVLLAGSLTANSDGYGSTASQIFQHSLFMSAFTSQPLDASLSTSFAQRPAELGGAGVFQLWTFDQNNVRTNDARGGLVVESFALSAVPEPDSWLLLTTGFGFAGAMMRRRRQAAALNMP